MSTPLPQRSRLAPDAFAQPIIPNYLQSEAIKRISTASAPSTTTAETPCTPPRTPSPARHQQSAARTAMPSVRVDRDASTMGESSTFIDTRVLKKVRSAERTRSWAEEVERRRLKGELETTKRERKAKSVKVDKHVLSDDADWHVHTNVIDTMLGVERYESAFPSAATVISNLSDLTRRSKAFLSSEGESESESTSGGDEPWRYRRDKRGSRGRKATSSTKKSAQDSRPEGGRQTTLSSMDTTNRKDSFDDPRRGTLSPHILTTSPTSLSSPQLDEATSSTPKPKTEMLSIDQIIAKHSRAITGAFDAAKVKARKDLGLPPSPLIPFTPDTQEGALVSPVLPSGNLQLGRKSSHTSTSVGDLTGLGIQLRPTILKPSRIDQSDVGSISMENKEGFERKAESHQPLSRLQQERSAKSTRVTVAAPLEEEVSNRSVTEEFIVGQALLEKLETGSITSSPGLQGRGTALSPPSVHRTPSRLHSSTPPMGSRMNSPTTAFVRLRKSSDLPRSDPPSLLASDPEVHAMAVYLRSARLNRYLHLARPFPERPLHVSLADIGDPAGAPVLVYLGVGCVRHLIALFDDLAKALKLRLICIDRWGFGKTDNVLQGKRDPMQWAVVVERVLAEIGVEDVRIIAHSAGAPYAAATAVRLGARVKGTINLLAPWISADIDGGYKWLKWVPNGVIKSAFAAEWKIQSYRLGKPPPLVHEPLSHIAEKQLAPTRPNLSRANSDAGTPPALDHSAQHLRTPSLSRRASQMLGKKFISSTNSSLTSPDRPASSVSPKVRRLRSMTPLRSRSDPAVPTQPSFESTASTALTSGSSAISVEIKSPDISLDNESFNASAFADDLHQALPRVPTSPTPMTKSMGVDKPQTSAALLHALEQASHAECEPGTTDDIMTIILNRPNRPWGFDYTDLSQPLRIWWGNEDDKISERSVRWMERSCVSASGIMAELRVVKGGDHNLMRSVPVMMEIFEGIAADVRGSRGRSG